MKIYQKIAEYLKTNQIDLKDISNKTGIFEHDLKLMLTGEKPLSLDDFIEIIIALKVDANFFMSDEVKERGKV